MLHQSAKAFLLGSIFVAVGVAVESGGAQEPNRNALLEKMQLAMGPVPSSDRKVPLSVEVHEVQELDGYLRKKISFASEANDRVPAWLLIPARRGAAASRMPAMLCLHQTIGIGKGEPIGQGDQESKRQALHLVQRGYVCLVPDYPSFGEYRYDFAEAYRKGLYQSGTMKAIWNNMRGIDLLQSLPEVDGDRIGAIGHSLGGHNSLFTAAFDSRIQVVVTSCGFNSFHKYYGGNLKGWTSDRYMPRIASVYGNDPNQVPFNFDDVLLAIYPRAIFVMAPLKDSNFEVSGVRDIVEKVSPSYERKGLKDKLQAVYPDAGHDWPEEERMAAYEFIDRILKAPAP